MNAKYRVNAKFPFSFFGRVVTDVFAKLLQEYIGLLLVKLLAKFPYKFLLDCGMLSFFSKLLNKGIYIRLPHDGGCLASSKICLQE